MSTDVIQAMAIAMQANVPPFILGSPGTGKSSISSTIASKMGTKGWDSETLLPALREPTDFAGLPVIINGKVVLAAPQWAQTALEGANANGGHLVIFDEVTCAPPSVQAALLRVVLERVVGDVHLPKTVRMMMIGNPPEEAAGGWDLAPPLMNRVCLLHWDLDPDAWSDFMLSRRADIAMEFRKVPDDFEAKNLSEASTLVVSFLQHRSNLRNPPIKPDQNALEPYPTPRSWDMASKLLAACMSVGYHITDGVTLKLLNGVVGEAAAREFSNWANAQDLPDPKYLLENPTSLKLHKDRNDRNYAILANVAAFAVSVEDAALRKEYWKKAWVVMATAAKAGRMDVAAASARTLARNQPPGVIPPPEVSEFAPLLRAFTVG